MNAPEKCFITDMPTEYNPSTIDEIDYYVNFYGKRFFFAFPTFHQNSEFVEKNKFILKGLIINEKFPYSNKNSYFDNSKLETIINEAVIPRSPKELFDNLLMHLFKHQSTYGARIIIDKTTDWESELCRLYFKNHNEYWFFLSSLKDQNLITFMETSTKDGNDAMDIKLTFKGLEYIINLQESGYQSKNCFIAMSFSESTLNIRETIKKVVLSLGYRPILIDELHYESEITINDAIVKFIKQSKFLIADFTEQKSGVYFEAGFALGLKRPVIYTCSKIDFKDSHFDTNHYPHIVYNGLDELEEKLKDKILAWIE
jgi:nucleoside 2-deoxyribosyltransferase